MLASKAPARAGLHLIFFILLLDIIGLSMLFPVAPYLVRRYSDDALMVTMMTVIYAAAQFVAAPVLGALGDHYGRRPVLLTTVLGSVVGYLILGVGGALWVLFLSRLISGGAAGNQSVAAAYIADVSTPETRAKNFTLIGMAWGLGLIVGPALGAGLGQLSVAAPAFAAAALALLGGLLGVALLPESLPSEQRATAPLSIGHLNPLASIGAMARRPGLRRPLLALCLFNFAFNGINSTETLFLIEKFAAQPWQLGALLVLAGITLAVVQRFVQRLALAWGEQRVAGASLVGQALGATATVAAPLFWLIFPLNVLRTATSGLIFPTLGALLAGRVSPREQGVLMGVTAALGSLMGILGPLWAGAMYEHLAPGAPYWAGAGVFVAAALVLVSVRSASSDTLRPQPGRHA